MHIKTIVGMTALFLLAGCGGGGDDSAPEDALNLQGLWYQRDPARQAYVNPLVVVQTGRDVLLRACDRSTTALRLEGGKLVRANGTAYSSELSGADNIIIPYGHAQYTELRKFSPTPLFNSGRLALGVPTLSPLQANQDVCAQAANQSYTAIDGVQVYLHTVLIAAPYMGGHVQLRLAFPTLRAGEFTVRERERDGFLQKEAGSAYVEMQSPAFTGVAGQDSLKISGGQVLVKTSPNGAYSFEGTVTTATGAQVTFSAEVVLEPRP